MRVLLQWLQYLIPGFYYLVLVCYPVLTSMRVLLQAPAGTRAKAAGARNSNSLTLFCAILLSDEQTF